MHTTLELRPVPPFRLDLTVWAIRRRPDNTIDRWDGQTYRRVLATDGLPPFEVAVSQTGTAEAPHLNVALSTSADSDEAQAHATRALQYLLGINLSLEEFYRLADGDERLRSLAGRFRGFKPPRFPSHFETLVNAISCQQLSLNVGIRLLCLLAARYGPAVSGDEGTFHAFPRPRDVAQADVDELRQMGFSYSKARYITGLAQAIVSGQLDLRELEDLEDEAALTRLTQLKGVGRWTAEYFLLRGLGRTHVFPADDAGARNNLQQWLGLRAPMSYEKIQRTLEPWQGFGGMVFFHLLLKSLDEKGLLPNIHGPGES